MGKPLKTRGNISVETLLYSDPKREFYQHNSRRRRIMKKKILILSFVLLLSLFCTHATAQVEHVFSLTVTDEETVIEAFDAWFSTDDSDYGQTAVLISVVANGSDPSTHYLVLDYPDYASCQAAIEGVEKSGEFAKMQLRVSGISTSDGESMYTNVIDNGKRGKAGDYQYIVGIDVLENDSEYIKAFNELINSEIGKKAPGSFRLVANRVGGDSDYLGIVTAPSFEALNKYMDLYTEDNKDWQKFLSEVEEISTTTGSGFNRILKIWE